MKRAHLPKLLLYTTYEDQGEAVAAANKANVRLEVTAQGRNRAVIEEAARRLAREDASWLIQCADGIWIACRAVARI